MIVMALAKWGEEVLSEKLGDQLRDLLYRQVEAAGDEAMRSGGVVAADQVESLGRLARLVEIHKAAQPVSNRKRWPAAVLFGSTLLIVSILLFARVGETEIEVDLAVSEVSFDSPTQQTLADTMDLSSLGVSGLREWHLPADRGNDEETQGDSGGAGSGLRLSVSSAGQRRGSLNLETLKVAADTRVWLRQTGMSYQYRLSLKGKSSTFRANVFGPVQVGFSGGGTKQLDSAAPRIVRLQSGEEDINFDLSLPGPTGSTFSRQLSASNLSLFEIVESLEPERTIVRRLSTVQSGSLYFVSLSDRERKLRSGEMISFEQSVGEFRTLQLGEDHIQLTYHGRVRGLSTGVDENRRSLMPTWLEWLSARHSLSLLWGTAIYLFGFAVAAFRWFGRTV